MSLNTVQCHPDFRHVTSTPEPKTEVGYSESDQRACREAKRVCVVAEGHYASVKELASVLNWLLGIIGVVSVVVFSCDTPSYLRWLTLTLLIGVTLFTVGVVIFEQIKWKVKDAAQTDYWTKRDLLKTSYLGDG
jgi:hypothetical protein